MVPNMQTDFKQTLTYKLLLCGHLEQEVIKIQFMTSLMADFYEYQITLTSYSRWTCSNYFYTSVCSKFVCVLSIIFILWSYISIVSCYTNYMLLLDVT